MLSILIFVVILAGYVNKIPNNTDSQANTKEETGGTINPLPSSINEIESLPISTKYSILKMNIEFNETDDTKNVAMGSVLGYVISSKSYIEFANNVTPTGKFAIVIVQKYYLTNPDKITKEDLANLVDDYDTFMKKFEELYNKTNGIVTIIVESEPFDLIVDNGTVKLPKVPLSLRNDVSTFFMNEILSRLDGNDLLYTITYNYEGYILLLNYDNGQWYRIYQKYF